MIKLLLGLRRVPSPHDAADALAVAICHLHSLPPPAAQDRVPVAQGSPALKRSLTSWRHYRPAQ
jgi:hypothetical protein